VSILNSSVPIVGTVAAHVAALGPLSAPAAVWTADEGATRTAPPRAFLECRAAIAGKERRWGGWVFRLPLLYAPALLVRDLAPRERGRRNSPRSCCSSRVLPAPWCVP